MEININNYEEFIVDFLDGKLDDNAVAKLFVFLGQNPAIKAEFDFLNANQTALPAESLAFDFSGLLKQEKINVTDYSDKLIAILENDLTPEETKTLETEIKSYPELAAEFELFKKTKLVPENDIVFANKPILTKKGGFTIIPLFARYSAVAAVFITVVMGVYFFTNNNGGQLADKVDTTIAKSKQDSITDIIKTKNNIPKQLQKENEKEMLAFGGVNAASMQKQNKRALPSTNKNIQNKKPIKENPLNGGNNQSIAPSNNAPKKPVAENGGGNNNLANIELPKNNNQVTIQPNIEETPVLTNNEPVIAANTFNKDKNLDYRDYVKEQLKIAAQSEVITENKPANSNENISLAESIGLNVLSLFNKVSNRDVKVKKTYNNDGEVEKVRFVASGW
ncbi:MAG: hypothetical protein JHD28_07630 [Bacteroidia bacterium]|nr:hypothetical protein [Bacteroidia bacterium]